MPQQDRLPNLPGGRPEHKQTEIRQRVVMALSSEGVPQDEIASLLGVDPKTLRKHYSPELSYSKTIADAAVKGTLFKKCVDDEDTQALIFWAKTQMGWKEKHDPWEDQPPTIEGEYAQMSKREFARKLNFILMEAAHGPYNQVKTIEGDDNA